MTSQNGSIEGKSVVIVSDGSGWPDPEGQLAVYRSVRDAIRARIEAELISQP